MFVDSSIIHRLVKDGIEIARIIIFLVEGEKFFRKKKGGKKEKRHFPDNKRLTLPWRAGKPLYAGCRIKAG